MMLGAAQFSVADRSNAAFPIPNTRPALSSSSSSSSHTLDSVVFRLGFRAKRRHRGLKSIRITCDSSSRDRSTNQQDYEYIQASLLLSETISHYRMQKRGFQEETNWNTSRKLRPFSVQATRPRSVLDKLGRNFLQRFQSPTIFLKISCDGDFLLPIVVGELAIENLINGHWGDENGDSPDQFQFVKSLVEELDHQVNMVRITERVLHTYFARLYFSKPGKSDILSVDARPSDAINVAYRCKAPIYVNKQIVVRDAVRISYGMGRMREMKPTYDVSLDSAADGPNLLAQELVLVKNIDLAIKEERYKDAAMWRDELVKLRKLSQGHQS
ncbi:PREDICTED: bifunctional nuclease 2 isoform X1 [Fragaria vesca subsp. vesca]|uniref:bifunctional nuclease 2 isoform X1 n=2 Tax=Fragaria vesca subsp. vesca TaxID=101020 RepID=UPI0002C2FA47|nr:PREDICTED: bifunctional nuclease 2 isoform X1 [Fragaria vesca subsp. vesca]